MAARRIVAATFLPLSVCAAAAGADAASTAAPDSAPSPAQFGRPPSGEIPILYNDHTVYATPDLLKRSRVLAALVKNGHMYVPLRSVFEQMGASVSASADGKTITATKAGAEVSVTVGKREVVLNGESRPLDVPPMIYKGIVLVPVRVLSEALGAYVQWEPMRRVVVVRYIASVAPVPEATPTVAPTAAPAAPPGIPVPVATPPPVQTSYGFIAAAYASPKNYNEFSAGQGCPEFVFSAAYGFKGSRFAVKVDYRRDRYVTSVNSTDIVGNQYTNFATIDGGTARTPAFAAIQSTLDGRLEYQIADPKIYVGVGYLHTANSFGYPQLNGLGAGIEKLPDLRSGVNFFGSAFYYPSASGDYTVLDPASGNRGNVYRQQYQVLKYDVGLALVSRNVPVYLYGGFSGDRYIAKQNAPIGQTHDGPYVGLGLKL